MERADRILYGGRVRTLDATGTTADAVAIHDGRVLALGTSREMAALACDNTEWCDLAGRTAIPGFIETHNHPYFFGLTLAAAVDAGSPPNESIADIIERVADAARAAEPGEWIVGYRYDDTLLADCRHPTRHDLDPVSGEHPVLLVHVSGHFVTANTRALRAAGIGPVTQDPPGGMIGRTDSGEPNGVLAETAAFPVYALLPKRSQREMTEILGLAGDAYLAAGVTTVHDTGIGLLNGADELDAYRLAIDSGRLRTRVRGYLFDRVLTDLGPDLTPQAFAATGSERFNLAGVKIISDGSIQGLTGCLSEPYTCSPGEHGMMLLSRDELTARVAELHANGWQVAVHGNGDEAIQAIIDAYTALGLGASSPEHRHRIEHCQTVREDQLDRMAANEILASFFVKHVYYWGDRHRDRFLGPDRARRINPLRSASTRGLRFGLHADTPVTPVPPLEGIWCAVARQTRNGAELGAEQRVDVDTALRAYTSEAAYLGHDETRTGSLEPGKLADIAVLSGDPATADSLRDLTVDATLVGGGFAWTRPGVTLGESERTTA